ncbi:MAG: putative N6-adenine-specific DNA methylase [Polyangiales bacterium]|jgi:putative N6-adenine-specific DNA methylase
MKLFATCLPGLEDVLSEELKEKHIGSNYATVPGGVEFEGELIDMGRANRELGVAQNIRVRIASFGATKLPQLANKSMTIPFDEWLVRDQPLRVRVTSRKSRLYHTGAIKERILRGVHERLGGETEEGDGQQILVRVSDNQVTVSFDSSGAPLHRRGYRLASAKAPLREDLACALVRVSGWDRRSPFVDPMMGSGTIAIEAAMLAAGMAPGANRRFAFQDAPLCASLELPAIVASGNCGAIFGSDRDAGAIEAASSNAERAGVRALLTLNEASLSAAPGLDGAAGWIVTNPPYGKRMGKKLQPLFQRLGTVLRDHSDWQFACVFPEGDLPKRIGINMKSALMSDHGGTKVRFFRRVDFTRPS